MKTRQKWPLTMFGVVVSGVTVRDIGLKLSEQFTHRHFSVASVNFCMMVKGGL